MARKLSTLNKCLIASLYLLISIFIGLIAYYYNQTKYNFNLILLQELELEYWGCKYYLVEECEKFIKFNAPDSDLSALELLNQCDRFMIDVRLPLSQGLIESHYGTKGLASKTNSVWNMGAFDGSGIDNILRIYKYPHPNSSIKPYLINLKTSYLGVTRTEEDLLRNFVTLNGKRYATNELYEQELRNTWKVINSTTKLDSLISRYNHLKVILNR